MTSQLWKTVISVVLIVSLFNERAEAVANAEEVIANSTVTKEFGEEIHDEVLHRMKRFLIFNNGGLVKNVLGILIPVQFGDNSKRSLNLGYNFQSQYLYPPTPLTVFNSPFLTGFNSRRNSRAAITNGPDETRLFVYSALETTWERRGRNGRQCILRAICEVAETPFAHNGMFGEIVDTIFTPHTSDEHHGPGSDYWDARAAGLSHADCQKTFNGCPNGDGFLDSISHFLH